MCWICVLSHDRGMCSLVCVVYCLLLLNSVFMNTLTWVCWLDTTICLVWVTSLSQSNNIFITHIIIEVLCTCVMYTVKCYEYIDVIVRSCDLSQLCICLCLCSTCYHTSRVLIEYLFSVNANVNSLHLSWGSHIGIYTRTHHHSDDYYFNIMSFMFPTLFMCRSWINRNFRSFVTSRL